VDGRKPAPVNRWFIPLFIGFLPSQVVQDFATIHSICSILKCIINGYFWVNYNDLTVTSLESWLVREIIPKWPLIQISELL
jgi:hypothetical protein